MAMRYPGGFITATAPTVNANTAKGVWTLEEAMQYIKAGQWPVPTGGGDPFFQYNTMLLPGQGTTGAQNNTFQDSSSNNFTVTRNGNTTQGTFTPFSGTAGNWSNFFDGTSSYLTGGAGSGSLGSGNFTVEAFVYATSTPQAYNTIFSNYTAYGTTVALLYFSSDSKVNFVANNTTITSTAALQLNTWNHVAAVRNSGTITLYVNGVAQATLSYSGSSSGSGVAYVGTAGDAPTTTEYSGFISNLRVVAGSAVYTSAFTPPTSPLTAISNTIFLTCQSNRFVDNSTNAYSVTSTGSPAVTPFQPFGAPTVAYSASTIGGSGYFDGSGDYLTVPYSSQLQFTGDFTIEFWAYPLTQVSAFSGVVNNYNSWPSSTGFAIFCGHSSASSTKWCVALFSTFPAITSTNDYIKNAWSHIALVRSGTGSNNITLYVNGVASGTATSNNTVTGTANNWWIGATGDGPSTQNFTGYLTDFRAINSAVYTSAFTPPTAPLTAGSSKLLLSYTNAGIIDNAQDNNLETVGGAQISTTQYKWGASSMFFDGTGDWVLAPSSQNIAMGTGDFTIEFWMYLTGVSGEGTTVYNSTSGGINLFMSISSNWGIARSGVGVDNNFGTPPAQNQWNHIAVSRSGSIIKAFINGNQVFAGANTSNYVAGPIQIGGSSFGTITGYIQDLRITKGLGRYLYNFTAPTAAFPLFWQAAATPSSDPYFQNTTLLLPGNGTNGSQNNTFLDSSTNAFTITRNGNTTQGTFTPFSKQAGAWGNYFDGTGDYFTSSTALFNYTTGNASNETFTIEAFVCHSARGTPSAIQYAQSIAAKGDVYLNLGINGSGNLIFYHYDGSVRSITGSSVIPLNVWTHVAVRVASGTATLYVNGVADGSGTWYGIQSAGQNSTSYFGTPALNASALAFNGYVSNLRVSNNARTITVPTAPYTNDANTVFLTEQSNRFVDNSSNAYAITPVGGVAIQTFSPFPTTASYSAGTNGGSGYFDGTGDFLTYTTPSASVREWWVNDFTVEAWIYPTTLTGWHYSDGTSVIPSFIGNASTTTTSNYWSFGPVSSGVVRLHYFNGAVVQVTSTATVNLNQWNHIAFTKTSSGIQIFVNGVGTTATAVSGTPQSSNTVPLTIGQINNTAINGYVSGVRIVNGTAVYSGTTYTVPTTPPTAITNTSFLLNYTNGGIIDNTMSNVLETVGGASISTAQSKFGGSSMYFDGSGDWLLAKASNVLSFETGDFTIEGWLYPTAVTGADRCLWDTRAVSTDSGMVLFIDTNGKLATYTSSALRLTSGASLSANTWTHFALVRYSGTMAFYINGFQSGTLAYSTTITCPGTVFIGARQDSAAPYTGYIDDLRITKGIARYVQNFTPPTQAFLTL